MSRPQMSFNSVKMRKVLVVLAVLQVFRSTSASNDENLELPGDLLIGVASAAYQYEGAWNVSDKGEGTWDRLTHSQPWRTNNDTGDVACDSYHKYKEDVQLVKDMGLNHYRISLSWPRILPTGRPDKISQDGIQYYHNLIDEILANGMKPFVTIFHFDDVQVLYEETGGWVNESMVELYADYARIVFREFGDKVKLWTTFNEPNIFCGAMPFVHEPAPPAYTARYQCVHNALKAHARAYHIYNDEFRAEQNGQVGTVVAGSYYYPKTSDDMAAQKVAFDFETGWVMHPIFSETGGYPEVMVKRIGENSRAEGLEESRLPEFSPEWIDYVRGSADYFGLNIYTSELVETVTLENGTWYQDTGFKKRENPKWPYTSSGWAIVPKEMGDTLMKIRDAYGNPPVYILENGLNGQKEIHDEERIKYLYEYMKEVLGAIDDGCDVRAYTIWSLLDNFQWTEGYSQRFGLYQVDFNDPERKRIPRSSVAWLKRVMAERRLISPDEM